MANGDRDTSHLPKKTARKLGGAEKAAMKSATPENVRKFRAAQLKHHRRLRKALGLPEAKRDPTMRTSSDQRMQSVRKFLGLPGFKSDKDKTEHIKSMIQKIKKETTGRKTKSIEASRDPRLSPPPRLKGTGEVYQTPKKIKPGKEGDPVKQMARNRRVAKKGNPAWMPDYILASRLDIYDRMLSLVEKEIVKKDTQ